ncbi:MAG: response regulator [Minisyncoccia bacterium]
MEQTSAKSILIVEDEPAQLDVLRDKFTVEGFSVSVAKNGEEGLASALAEHPDVILLDIILPVMDGLTMLRKLREDEWGSAAKVVVLTSLTANDLTDIKSSSVDLDYFLMKTDWTLDGVVQVVKKRLGMA